MVDIKIVLFLTFLIGGIEGLICRFSRRKIINWILPIVFFIISLVLILIGRFVPLEGMQDLAYLVTGMLAGISSLISSVVAVIDLIVRKSANKKTNWRK